MTMELGRAVLAALALAGCGAPASGAEAARAEGAWPPLPSKFVAGRTATEEDVKAGRAFFVAAVRNGPPSEPLAMEVPQYARCEVEGRKFRAIVIQAERAAEIEMLGLRDIDAGKNTISVRSSCELLGQSPP
jgi:hypothetical protein